MLDDLDDSALDDLPFGVVCLSDAMTVVRMNRAESEASGIQRWRAIGRDFFSDVAPGPSNRALAEHIRAFAAGGQGVSNQPVTVYVGGTPAFTGRVVVHNSGLAISVDRESPEDGAQD